jgi:hypothetical protein
LLALAAVGGIFAFVGLSLVFIPYAHAALCNNNNNVPCAIQPSEHSTTPFKLPSANSGVTDSKVDHGEKKEPVDNNQKDNDNHNDNHNSRKTHNAKNDNNPQKSPLRLPFP